MKGWLSCLLAAMLVSGLGAASAAAGAAPAPLQWRLVNPEGVIQIQPMKLNPHPSTLEGKTILLRWNGKHNGDKFLERVAELLVKNVKGVKVVKNWEVAPETVGISQNPDRSKEWVKLLAAYKPDIVIASQAD